MIQWTSTRDRVTSNGNIVALCRRGKNDKSRTPLVYVSYDQGFKWNNVTALFTNADNSSALSIEKYYIVEEKPNFVSIYTYTFKLTSFVRVLYIYISYIYITYTYVVTSHVLGTYLIFSPGSQNIFLIIHL